MMGFLLPYIFQFYIHFNSVWFIRVPHHWLMARHETADRIKWLIYDNLFHTFHMKPLISVIKTFVLFFVWKMNW